MTNDKKYDLADAYSVSTPEDNKALYDNWASTYDDEFVQQRGYQSPDQVAKVYAQYQQEQDAPALDIGAGTGLAAQALRDKGLELQIDAIDISREMLAKSKAKQLYNNYITADLNETLPIKDEQYGGLFSAGTFTHGHVGPQVFKELLRIAKPDALFCLGIKIDVFDNNNFGSALAVLQADKKISPVEFVKIRHYNKTDHDHSGDTGLVAVFRKT